MKIKNPRTWSARILLNVLNEKKSLTEALHHDLAHYADVKQHSLIQEICYGVMRWYYALCPILSQLLQKPMRKEDRDIEILILVGLFQLHYTRIPPHAAISETVDACLDFKKPWATRLVNAVLRNFQRRSDELIANVHNDEEFTYAHPHWLLDLLQQAWPHDWQAIIAANNQHPPMTLRINPLKTTKEQYTLLLDNAGIKITTAKHAPFALRLEKPVAVSALPGFNEGLVSVQDESSQLIATLLELKPGLRVLDACAAPGGKTAAIFESEPLLKEIVALDHDEYRLKRVKENQQRLGFKATIKVGDAAHTHWFDGDLFDRILIDAPCTATGVIRRHPDIKYLRQASDIKTTVFQQKAILNALWPLLKKDGILIYSTCSLLPDENELQLQAFLNAHHDAKVMPITALWGQPMKLGRQIFSGEDGMDGFYYGRIIKS